MFFNNEKNIPQQPALATGFVGGFLGVGFYIV